ncbi:MAG: HAD-IA family hydrolase [Clostridia bacterium]|nr:HAD-IA family hydrolase [Clostridia bacterium]
MIKGFVFDLDDTLYLERDYVRSGFCAIAQAFGDERLSDELMRLFTEDRRNVYQRAGFSDEECGRCIAVYRQHLPDIRLSDAAKDTLSALRARGCRLGILTDGRPQGQRNKIQALGLEPMVDAIVVTDELGGEAFRKPNPTAFQMMKEALALDYDEMVYVGDNPIKDFVAPKMLGMQACYLRNPDGLYFSAQEIDPSIPTINDITEVLTL